MKKTVLFLSITVLIMCVIAFVLDLINITQYIPLSKSYDWLTFGGIIVVGLANLIGICSAIRTIRRDRKRHRYIDESGTDTQADFNQQFVTE